MQSQYAKNMQLILAALQESEEAGENTQPLPDEPDQEEILHAYPVTIGGVAGVLHTKEEIPPEYFTDSTVYESQETDSTPQPKAQPQKEASFFPHFFLILCFFLLLDNVSNTIPALLTPTAIITIIPKAQQITFTGNLPLGRVLEPIIITQSQTTPATGRGHQNATRAMGQLIFFNGSFVSQTIDAGTIYTGADGIQVVTDHTVTIPAANPPYVGQATIAAHALTVGATGNIKAGDIAITTTTLQVRNSPFYGGQDERDFRVVTKEDINNAAATLTGKVTASMNAALQQQLLPAEQSATLPCHPTIYADHAIGSEATQVTVTVSQTCTIIAYNSQELTARATKLLTFQAGKQLGNGYMLYGTIHISITKVATPKPNTVLLSFSSMGTWLYRINQQQLITLIAGKPRQQALHLLSSLPGIRQVSITGIADNNPLPLDMQHMKFLEVVGL